ncbi:MAG TPA: hypothetical protein VGB98_09890 [Pyrinomonadaceae bacterium]|jgi:hypothetical protein
MSPDYQIAYVNDRRRLLALSGALASSPVVALDIETASWWDPRAERVSLVQLAYRGAGGVRVAVVDALSLPDPDELRAPLESGGVVKAIHNAAFDASRIERHFGVRVSPIHDTMLAARRGGERGCSLKAQAGKHLGLGLDKGEQQGDWGTRPLHPRQIAYAALDAAATLLLYEHQVGRGLRGDYRPRARVAEVQGELPLAARPPGRDEALDSTAVPTPPPADADLTGAPLALLGVIYELPSRYGPERLAASVGEDRVGLAGWVVDRVLGEAAEVDEASAKEAIAILCGRGLVRLTSERRLEASPAGRDMWERRKPG